MANQRHLDLESRNYIEQALSKNLTFKEIAYYLDKDSITISKEVKKHRIRKEGQSIHVNFNHCSKHHLVEEKISVVEIVKNNVDTALIAIVLIFQRVFVRG